MSPDSEDNDPTMPKAYRRSYLSEKKIKEADSNCDTRLDYFVAKQSLTGGNIITSINSGEEVKLNRNSYLNTHRDAWVEVNLDSIEKNILQFKKYLKPNTKLFAVVKADAYGHGAVMIAPILIASGVDFLGVSSIDEALQLREAKITTPILVLGAVPVWSFDWAATNNISISIFSEEHIEACKQTYEKTKIKTKVHIKIDTGMNRIGVNPENAIEFIKKIQACDFIELEGIFTHFATAESETYTLGQYKKFRAVVNAIDSTNLLIHCCNTAAVVSYNNFDYNMARVGIGIYGLQPDIIESATAPNLKQAISLKGRITNIHTAKANEGVSYSHTFETQNVTKIATIPLGYADGVPRGLSNKIFGIINGKKVKQIGNITMDQMMFDITSCDAAEGDIITLLGEDSGEFISVDEWAKILNTIHYEITCALRVRLPRVYTR